MSLTRDQAERAVRAVLRGHLGEKFPPNLFKDSVDQLLETANARQSTGKGPEGCHEQEDQEEAPS